MQVSKKVFMAFMGQNWTQGLLTPFWVWKYQIVTISRKQGRGYSQGISQLTLPLWRLVTVYCTLQCTLYTVQWFYFSVQYIYLGCPGTQWDVTKQPVKTRPKLLCQNKSYGGHKLVVYFSLYSRMQKKTVGQKVFPTSTTYYLYLPSNKHGIGQ